MSQEEPEEKEIFPGVYFTDLRKNKGAPAASNPVYATQGEALQLEIRELENSIWHMKRSNQEINQVLQAEGHDQELVDAIEENKALILKREIRVRELRSLLPPHLQADNPNKEEGSDAGMYL